MIRREFFVTLSVRPSPDKFAEAMHQVEVAYERINTIINAEQQRLLSLFPTDDFAQDDSQRRGCCG